MLRKICVVMMLAAFCVIAFGAGAQAHNLWLNPDNFFPEVGATVEIGIGWGHTYPATRMDQEIRDGQLESVQAVDPDGATLDLAKVLTGK